MRRILVTGAAGQLGREVHNASKGAAGRDFEWIFADHNDLDITDREALAAYLDKTQPDLIVNCAAYTDVEKAESDRDEAFRINYDGARFLAEASSLRGISIIHISTDYLFDGKKDTPYDESDIPSPINVYGESKLAGARTILESGCSGAVVRTAWLYSPWGRNFVTWVLNTAEKNDEIRVVSDQRGCPTSAASLARAIIAMIPQLLSREPRLADVYHYCDTGAVSRSELAIEVIKLAGLNCRVIPILAAEYPTAAKRPAYSAMDTSKITRDFGVVPPAWKDALKECIDAIKDGR